jgi:predicted AAA+ superfamily ATPase
MIRRKAENKLKLMAEKFPVLVLTGPRQSGKTTLAKMVFSNYQYVSLENPQNLEFALNDPNGFLQLYNRFIIFDEVQNAPELFSYLQQIVDDSNIPGQFVLSGSQNFLLLEKITQTLAGRVYLMELLPLCHSEINQLKNTKLEDELFNGSYPRIYNMGIEPKDFYPNYTKTYVERDVRTILRVQDLKTFKKMMTLLAHHAGQLFNASELSKKLKIDSKTIQNWLSILETSYIAFTLEPWHNNLSKRVIKMPKLYFYDTGLLCYLLGIKSAEEIQLSSYKGAIFENYTLLEIMKSQKAKGNYYNYYFWRDSNQNEIDLIIEESTKVHCFEIKASLTVKNEHLKALHYLDKLVQNLELKHYLVNFFEQNQQRSDTLILSWKELENYPYTLLKS